MKFKASLLSILLLYGFHSNAQNETYLFPANFGRDGKAGFIDSTGKLVIPYLFDEVSEFSDGLAPARIAEKWGYIDKSGHFVITPQFVYAYPFSYGVAKIYYQDKTQYINKNGHIFIVQAVSYDDYSEGMIKIKIDDLYGFADCNGKTIVPAEYEKAFDFGEGIGYALKGGTWYFFNKEGKILFQTKNNPVGKFSEGLIQVYIGDKYGFMDMKGKMVIPATLQYRNSTENPFSDGLAVFQEGPGYHNYKMGCFDKTGKVVIKPTFSLIYNFKNGFAAFSENKDGYIDKKGKIVIPAEYENAFEFSEDFAIAIRGMGGGKFQYEIINTKGEVIKTYEAYEGIREQTKYIHGLCKLHQTIAPSPELNDENMRQWGGVKTIYVNKKGEKVWESEPWYSCFPGYAKVLLSDFTQKPIEQIAPGNEILTFNNQTNLLEKAIVTEVHEHIGSYSLIEIFYSDASVLTTDLKSNVPNSMRSIKLTENHPIMTSYGFVPAGNLDIGDEIETYNSLSRQIETIKIEKIVKDFISVNKVYNLKIKGQNYIVDGVMVMMK